MKASTADKLMAAGCAGGLTAWCGSLLMDWSNVFDTSGRGELVRLIAFFAAVWAAFRLAGVIGRYMRVFAGRLAKRLARADNTEPAEKSEFAGQFRRGLAEAAALLAAEQWKWGLAQVRSMLRLLAAAMILAVALGLVSMLGMHLAGVFSAWLLRSLLWTAGPWTVIEFSLVFICSLPMCLGAAAVFHAALMMRCGSGKDVYAAICRDWLAGTSAGLAALGLLWWAGMNMAAVSIAICIPLVFAAAVIMIRKNIAPRAGRFTREDSPATARGGWVTAIFIAAMTAGLMAQLRLLADLGAGPAGVLIWTALSMAGLTWFMTRQDRKSAPPGVTPELGSFIGLSAGGCMQAAVLIAGAASTVAGAKWLCLFLAASAQPGLLHFAAIVISRRRRLFVATGGRAGRYAGLISAGLTAGLAAFFICGWLVGWGGLLVAAIAPSILAAGLFAARTRQEKSRTAWQAWGATMAGSLAVCILGATGAAPAGKTGQERGLWLTADFNQPNSGGPIKRSDYLPAETIARSEAITIALYDLLAEFTPPSMSQSGPAAGTADLPSRWLVIAGGTDDLPAKLPRGLNFVREQTDPSAATGLEISYRHGGDFYLTSRLDRERFDGIIFSPLPAGHPQAWRCYNDRTLRQLAGRLHNGGLLVVRLRAEGGNLGWLLAAAKTFRMVLGSGWAIADLHEGGCELLLIGPTPPAVKPARVYGTYVVPVEKLWQNLDSVSPVLPACQPGPMTRNIVNIHELRAWLDGIK